LIALGRTAEGEEILRAELDDARRNQMDVRQVRISAALGDLARNEAQRTGSATLFLRGIAVGRETALASISLAAVAASRLAAISAAQSLSDAQRFSRNSVESTFAGHDAFDLPRMLATSAEVELRRGNVRSAERDCRRASDPGEQPRAGEPALFAVLDVRN
jgi:hypothetical protein